MAAQFYARYVPPPLEQRPRGSHTEKSTRNLLDDSKNDHAEPKRSRKRKWPRKVDVDGRLGVLDRDIKPLPSSGTGLDEDESEGDLGEHTKHTKLKLKFEESRKASTKLQKPSQGLEASEIDDTKDSLRQEGPEAIYAEGLVPIPQPPETAPPPIPSAFAALPKWIGQPTIVPPSRTVPFEDLNLSASTLKSLGAKDYKNAFAIQVGVIPMLLGGSEFYSGDICISSATGSGKTLAYTLPMVEAFKDRLLSRLRGLVIVPTRELVTQVRDSFQASTVGTGLVIGTAVGNQSMKEERKMLISRVQRYDPEAYSALRRAPANDDYIMEWPSPYEDSDDELDTDVDFVRDYESKVHILICTPGRLVDHMKFTKGFTLHHVEWLVIDEADKLLDNSFQRWVGKVIPALEYEEPNDPQCVAYLRTSNQHGLRPRKVRKVILSATVTRDISKLIPLKLSWPRLVVMGSEQGLLNANPITEHATNVDHGSLSLPNTLAEFAISILGIEDKPLYLLKLLTSNPESLFHQKGRPRDRDREKTPGNDLDASSLSSTSASDSSSESESTSVSSTSDTPLDRTSKRLLPGTCSTLIFTHSNESALRLSRLLTLLSPSISPMLHTLTKSQPSPRLHNLLKSFGKSKRSQSPLIIIASDRASRGLDIPHLTQVINYDMPTSPTTYVHRVGRTARAGRKGRAITFVERKQGRWFWGEVGRGDTIRRDKRQAVKRVDWRKVEFGEEERKRYEEALGTLGVEARGG